VAAHLVILEDDPAIGASMGDALTDQGYEVDWHSTAGAATLGLEERSPDLVLIDLGLPDIDGLTVCRWLHDLYPDLPIILVTARDSDIDVVVGLDAGATDYVTKPFSMSVLLARVRAHLRTVEPAADAPIVLGRLVVEPAAYRARLDGLDLELRKREFELLAVLAREAGRVVTRERLLSEVWDLHWESTSKTLEMHVLALRRKLGESIHLTTVRGVGYRLDP
jgi:DNA-binding response OmpR family regulator